MIGSSAPNGSSISSSGGIGGERAREPDALALAAGELRGVALRVVLLEADELEQLGDRARGSAASCQPSSRGTVAMFSPIVMCGKRPSCWIT